MSLMQVFAQERTFAPTRSEGLHELALFAGGGGSLLAGHLLGWRTVCAVELDSYCRRVLLARQRDGLLPRFPIWDDVQTFDGNPWRGHVDVVSGGFPCQDLSNAGKRAGITGARSGLWAEFARILGEVRPRYAFIENVPGLAVRGLDRVLADLAALGMDARWCCLGADDVGAPHIRKRLWILAYASSDQLRNQPGRRGWQSGQDPSFAGDYGTAGDVADAQCAQWGTHNLACRAGGQQLVSPGQESPTGVRAGSADGRAGWWGLEPAVGRVAPRMAHRVDQLRALGNGWVPHCAALAWRILTT